MNFTVLLNPLLVAVVFFGASIVALHDDRIDRAIPKLLLVIWFIGLWLYPNTFSTEVQRGVARWLLLVLGLVEVVGGLSRLLIKTFLGGHGEWYNKI